MAAILSLNGAKNNPKIVTKVTQRSGQGGLAQGPLNTPLVYCIQTIEDIVKFLSGFRSPIILVFHPKRRAQNTRGGKILQFSTDIAVYLKNGRFIVATER